MRTVPVRASRHAHVEPDEGNISRAPLGRQIKGLVAAIPSTTDSPYFIEVHARASIKNSARNAWEGIAGPLILADLHLPEPRRPLLRLPPCEVAGIKRVGPWAELPGCVDGEELCAPSP